MQHIAFAGQRWKVVVHKQRQLFPSKLLREKDLKLFLGICHQVYVSGPGRPVPLLSDRRPKWFVIVIFVQDLKEDRQDSLRCAIVPQATSTQLQRRPLYGSGSTKSDCSAVSVAAIHSVC